MFLKAAVTSGAMFETRFNSGGHWVVGTGGPDDSNHAAPLHNKHHALQHVPSASLLLGSPPVVCPLSWRAVERLVHYWGLPQEAPAKKPEVEPEPEWPQDVGLSTYFLYVDGVGSRGGEPVTTMGGTCRRGREDAFA